MVMKNREHLQHYKKEHEIQRIYFLCVGVCVCVCVCVCVYVCEIDPN